MGTNVLLSRVKNQFILGWAFVRMLTIQKILNLMLLRVSFWLSQELGQVILWGKPTTLSIEPTTSCNLRCPECPSGLRAFTRPTGMLQEELYRKIIDQSKNSLTWLHLYFQGEPFLNPGFLELVHYANSRNIFTSTSTNAHYLNAKTNSRILDSGLKQLIVSMDGVTQESYEKYRIGGHLEKVQNGLRELLDLRKEKGEVFPRIIVQFLVTGQNEHEIPALKRWAKEIGVDELQLKSIQIYDYQNGSELIPSDLGYSRYIPDGNGKWKLKKKIENKCWRMWQGAVVTWDGKVVPCCFDKDAKYVMGDFNSQKLPQIWKSTPYSIFRKQLLSDRNQIEICRNCTE
ncbi:radical SAM additional 4Fe4S-binding SPASM domain-containing protein [Algoriphagus hitonicola]|uniref:Radical SAM additional 4Fe4S-binding SPASM domain-containing protein n=2 Tax=Algoriphagus hitonicola TaxID=435880 RepID=A0A1I2S8Y6_9BACT|nr:radical SAM/SPASM domain-containing protein [Algoriphagus hitonicola]SFG49375.1 radical SAM additional 4Fe4S-binding SPASM domain-containing protein [Algoriphagus hitonicola]